MAVRDIKSGQKQSGKPNCILLLQGGGAMGAYHIGAYQAMREGQFEPDWVCGISIGAINAAIIAGNEPEERLERLQAFWQAISRPSLLPATGGTQVRTWEHDLSYGTTVLLGQPGFFIPRLLNPYLAPPGAAATSFYDTAPLFDTLPAMADFDRLNRNVTRLSVGATDVETGVLRFFDTKKLAGRFGPEHVIASGSLPPGFPATLVNGRPYWDGGCVSNTPLDAVLDDMPAGHSVVFVIDLWSASGPNPTTMNAVEWRAKQIQYASSTPRDIQAAAARVNLRHARHMLNANMPAGQRMDLVHIIYHPTEDQFPASDAEFSRASIEQRRLAGLADMRRALKAQPWLRAEKPPHVGCMTHRVTEQGVTTLDSAK